MNHPYEDILHLPYRKSTRRPRMTISDRAAQFSPFAALTGFDAAIAETGRLTDRRTDLEDYGSDLLNQTLLQLKQRLPQQPEISICYFLPDSRKSGGCYQTVTGNLKKLDLYRQRITLTDGQEIPMADIVSIQCSDLPGE